MYYSPLDKVSEVIDRDGRAHQTVAGKDMVYDGSTVVLKERKPDCSLQQEIYRIKLDLKSSI